MKEKLFMQRRKKWLNISRRDERRVKHKNCLFRGRGEMYSLAYLASGFVMSFYVVVGRVLGDEYNKQHR